LEQKFKLLTKFPEMGGRREQLAAGLRGLSYGRYVIYYIYYIADLATDANLIIVRVLHSARDAVAIFGEDS
jgi:plasmid stabilization system protein ParE